jgi:hypothetical protein
MKNLIMLVTTFAVGATFACGDNEFSKCPSTADGYAIIGCGPAIGFAGRTSKTLLLSEQEFYSYFDLLRIVFAAEPLTQSTFLRRPFVTYGNITTQDERIGESWARGSFDTKSASFNELADLLQIRPNGGYGFVRVDGAARYSITAQPHNAMVANPLLGAAYERVGVQLERDESENVGDSTWTWIDKESASIDLAVLIGNCLPNSCGTHYFKAEVSPSGATVWDKGGFVPPEGLQLAPGTIPLPN